MPDKVIDCTGRSCFSQGRRVSNFLGEQVVKYHKTLTTYVNGLIRQGFGITGLVEPEPGEKLLRTVAGMNDVKNSSLRQSMSRKGNCWDNAPQESFFGHMKDELAEKIPNWTCFADVQRSIDDWMDYYNNDRYQWDLAKLSPNEYYQYLTTGSYPC